MSGRVCAVVVTYNRRDLLRECLVSLQAQTHVPDTILVVNNASTDGTAQMLSAEFAQLEVLTLAENVGGAGGFHAGMKWAYEQGYDWLWLMDDDGRAAPDCLEKLLAHARPNSVMVPVQQDSSGRLYGINEWRNNLFEVTGRIVAGKQPVSGNFTFAFVGPLIARTVVEKVGLPNKDFFIWFDDHEYALRIQTKTEAEIVVVPDAIFSTTSAEKKGSQFLGSAACAPCSPRGRVITASGIISTHRHPNQTPSAGDRGLFSLADQASGRGVDLRAGSLGAGANASDGIRDGALGRLGKRVPVK
jgi:GT2 family glycosyltransferase